jgi:hypothetical protein
MAVEARAPRGSSPGSKGDRVPKGGRYIIEPRDGDWVVTSSGRTVRRFATKKEAMDEGTRRAKTAKGQLVVKGRDGRIQSERTYGTDPYPPAG